VAVVDVYASSLCGGSPKPDSVYAGNLILNRYTARSVSLFFAFVKRFMPVPCAGVALRWIWLGVWGG
jgi:hypothetical protein